MRRKLLFVFICFLVSTLLVSCGRLNTSQGTDIGVTENLTGEMTDDTLLIPVVETEKTADLQEIEKADDAKGEKHFEKSQVAEDSITDGLNSTSKDEKIEKNVLECTLIVRCDTVFENMNKLDKEKMEILPKNGIILPKTEVVFYEGESVFNVLTRELKKNKIHIDFVNTPMYNTVYIKGISNLYEHDCGELSGWIYKVNGKVPGYGCSQCILNDGDKIEFVYTCNLGKDIN